MAKYNTRYYLFKETNITMNFDLQFIYADDLNLQKAVDKMRLALFMKKQTSSPYYEIIPLTFVEIVEAYRVYWYIRYKGYVIVRNIKKECFGRADIFLENKFDDKFLKRNLFYYKRP